MIWRYLLSATTFLFLGALSVPEAIAQGAQPGRYFVEFRDFRPGSAEVIRAAGGQTVHEFPQYRAIAAWLPAQAAAALSRNPNVAGIEEDPRRFPFGETVPYGIPMVQANLVSDAAAGNTKVCIIDSGYYLGHEDLGGNSVSGNDDPGGAGSWSVDRCGHGTHVAGTVAAIQNGLGVAGVLPGAKLALHIVKVFGDDCAWAYSSDLIAALSQCRAAGSRVVSMSLGGPFKNRFEDRAFRDADRDGLLSFAAAGNNGSNQFSYPASYNSVVSVAAVDSAKVVADFSQKNSQVELAAPGVDVLSTVPWRDTNTLTVDLAEYQGNHIENAARDTTSGTIVDGGLCDASSSWSGNVVLCERGNISFFEKVTNVQAGGGSAAVIYNNAPGNFLGTLGDGNSSAIPAISLSQQDGQFLVANKPGSPGYVVSTFESPASGYERWDGTSMATPHASGVAALVWSHDPSWTNDEIRNALQQTAEDLGPAGRDNASGYGLLQARAALDYLTGGTPPPPPPPGGITLTAQGRKDKGDKLVDLTWSGASSAQVEIYRDNVLLATVNNTGAYTDASITAKGTNTYTYRVCEAGASPAVCSNDASVKI